MQTGVHPLPFKIRGLCYFEMHTPMKPIPYAGLDLPETNQTLEGARGPLPNWKIIVEAQSQN